MLFNSTTFLIFFTIVYCLYIYLQRNLKWQNRMLVIAGCVFYGWWDWRYLLLLLLTMIIDYNVGKYIFRTDDQRKRKIILTISIISNLVVLGFFKYFNFFMDGATRFLSIIGIEGHSYALDIILPVGISFYTFVSMSYTIDIYRRHLKPAGSFFDFATFVTFFPQLLAGPIAKANQLLPQMISKRELKLDQIYEGCYLIVWGLFKKVYVADNLALIVNPIFATQAPYNGMQVFLGAYAFAFQIYCDFSGYTDIARGLAKCMGVDLILNFNMPYFSTNPSEFWQRWHISLSTWLRDYLYIPLGGNQRGELVTYRNLALTMLLGGLWHGAKWTFVAWGAYHGFLLIVYKLIKPYIDYLPELRNVAMRKIWLCVRIIFFFNLVCVGWIFFRAESITQSFQMITSIINIFTVHGAEYLNYIRSMLPLLVQYLWLLILVDIFCYRLNEQTVVLKSPVWIRSLFYFYIYLMFIFFGGLKGGEEFIYFQF